MTEMGRYAENGNYAEFLLEITRRRSSTVCKAGGDLYIIIVIARTASTRQVADNGAFSCWAPGV